MWGGGEDHQSSPPQRHTATSAPSCKLHGVETGESQLCLAAHPPPSVLLDVYLVGGPSKSKKDKVPEHVSLVCLVLSDFQRKFVASSPNPSSYVKSCSADKNISGLIGHPYFFSQEHLCDPQWNTQTLSLCVCVMYVHIRVRVCIQPCI